MDLNPRTQRRLDRIKDEVDILELLEQFGFAVRAGMDREQQFSCRLHGDGRDSKPSARVYPESASWYCWACQKSRDAVSTVREIHGLSFMDAIKWLEGQFSLPAMGHEPGDGTYTPLKEMGQVVQQALDPHKTFDDDAKSLSGILDMVTEDRALPLARVTAFWDAYDRVVFLVQGKGQSLPEHKGREALAKIKARLMGEIRGD